MSFDALFHKKVKRFLPKHARPEKIIREVTEHLVHYRRVILYILFPLMFFYLGMGIFIGQYSGGAAIFALLVSFYASFLPEADLLLAPGTFLAKKGRIAKTHEKYLVLMFVPLYLYLIAAKRVTPIFMEEHKPFHTVRALLVFSIFIFGIGMVLYASFFKAIFLAIFGAVGYLTHLFVDKMT